MTGKKKRRGFLEKYLDYAEIHKLDEQLKSAESIGTIVADLRNKANLSQEELADKMNISVKILDSIEEGTYPKSVTPLKMLGIVAYWCGRKMELSFPPLEDGDLDNGKVFSIKPIEQLK